MAPNPRVAQAFRAMRVLGIREEVVKPVLKNLLKLYEKNWQLIEEENYRALADAIFEQAEQAAEAQNAPQNAPQNAAAEAQHAPLVEMDEEALAEEEPERPLKKRLRLRYQDSQPSSSLGNPTTNSNGTLLIIPKEEESELPEACPALRTHDIAGSSPLKRNSNGIVSPPLTRSKGKQSVLPGQERLGTSEAGVIAGTQPLASRTESDSVSPKKRLREKGKEPISPQVAKKSVPERSTRPLCLKEPVAESGTALLPKKQVHNSLALIVPKDEPLTDDTPHVETPLAVILPEPLSNNNASRNGSIRKCDGSQLLIAQSVQGDGGSNGDDLAKKGSNCKLTNTSNASSSNLEIASLPSGEVKISLTCNSAVGRPDFHMPSIDDVLKTVEDKCLKSFKVLDPSFSLTKLMKDVCECFLELSSDSANGSQETFDEIAAGDSSLKSAAVDATGIPFDPSSNGNINSSNAAQAAPPEILEAPPLSSCCIDDSAQANTRNTENEQNNGQQNSLERVLPPNQPCGLHDDLNDIAKGQEKYVISFVNEVNNESPPAFHYIPQNVIFQNAYVNFSLARIGENCCSSCSGNCLSSPTPCACVHETDGDFPYTLDGLIKEDFLEECISMNRDPEKHCQVYCKDCPIERAKNEDIPEPCKGHLMRKFIKECWWKCGCSKFCGNRVVQRGINCHLQVFMTPEGKGWGLRTLTDLPKGAFVCEYVGEILTNAELFERNTQPSSENHSYPVLLDADWGAEGVLKDEEALCLDATHFGNVARFINHRCFDSNMVEIPVEVETPDHHYYHLAFFTTRKVQAMEELTWDYGIDFDDHDHPVKAFKCHCGSKFCRNIKRSSRSRSAGKRRRCT